MKPSIILPLVVLFSTFLIISLINTVFGASLLNNAIPFWLVMAFVIALFAFIAFVIALLKLSHVITTTLMLSKNSESHINLSMPVDSDNLNLSNIEEKMINKNTISDTDAMFITSKSRLIVLMIIGPAIIGILGILVVMIPADVVLVIVALGLLLFMIIVMVVTAFYHFNGHSESN